MPIKDKNKIGIVFGVFDGLHKGHEYLLNEALKLCDELKVVLAQPETVLLLKGHNPRFSLDERISALRVFNPKIHVIPGDKNLGDWTIFKKIKTGQSSSIVILGYDQKDISSELKRMGIPFITLPSHHPEKYKSRLLKKLVRPKTNRLFFLFWFFYEIFHN